MSAFLIGSLFAVMLILIAMYILLQPASFRLLAQQSSYQDFVTYEKHSNFIQEFEVPVNERGLKGIVTDDEQNVWFYHGTNKSSTIMKMSLDTHNFTAIRVPGDTNADSAVINLAGGQLLFDNFNNVIWFTDARVNSLGKLDIKTSKIELFHIPTNNSGIMGLALSPDRKFIWFTEIIGNKIGSLDIENNKIVEYPTGDTTGPTLLTIDSNGVMWVTLSYANSILRVEPWLLIPGSMSTGMYSISLGKTDSFSPFGIAIAQVRGIEKIFLSDHGSSRVIVSNISSDLKSYTSYWTSPSMALPMSLPSQVVSDKNGNVFFVEHGGNKVGKISSDGIMTEFDIPTGPLATSVFLTVTENGKKIWFTEWASNKIGYLDNTLQVPLTISVTKNQSASMDSDITSLTLKTGGSLPLNLALSFDKNSSSLAIANDTKLSLVGMTDSGLQGVKYTLEAQSVNLMEAPDRHVEMDLGVETENAMAGNYTFMIRASLLENDGLVISLLYPQLVKLDVPNKPAEINKIENFQQFSSKNDVSSNTSEIFSDLIRIGAIAVIIILVGYLIYHKIVRRSKFNERKS